MKIKKELALEISDFSEKGQVIEGCEIVDVTDWDDQGKYQHKSYIFKKDEKFYDLMIKRAGSYFTDYYYSFEDWGSEVDVTEVVPKEIVKTIWVNA